MLRHMNITLKSDMQTILFDFHEFNEIIRKNVENQERCIYKIAHITVAKCHRVPNNYMEGSNRPNLFF